jgi:hypothetical protein
MIKELAKQNKCSKSKYIKEVAIDTVSTDISLIIIMKQSPEIVSITHWMYYEC